MPGEHDERERWNRRYRAAEEAGEPSPFLLGLDPCLPRSGRALDVAGGTGRHALWLAARGLEVTLVDVSDVAVARARERARTRGLALDARTADLEREPLPAGPWHVILCFHYLQRSLFPRFAEILAPDGWLVGAIATVRNLERHARPSRRFLLEAGELRGLVPDLEVVSYREDWWEDGRHEARLVARRQAHASARAGRYP